MLVLTCHILALLKLDDDDIWVFVLFSKWSLVRTTYFDWAQDGVWTLPFQDQKHFDEKYFTKVKLSTLSLLVSGSGTQSYFHSAVTSSLPALLPSPFLLPHIENRSTIKWNRNTFVRFQGNTNEKKGNTVGNRNGIMSHWGNTVGNRNGIMSHWGIGGCVECLHPSLHD